MLTGTDTYGYVTSEDLWAWLVERPGVQNLVVAYELDALPAPGADLDGMAGVAAYVNHGRWVADCPSEGCGGALELAQLASFLCPACLNAGSGHQWQPVRWPPEQPDIEAVLGVRPLLSNRNWRPGESIADLERENAENGMGA
jgi:hypothetical protein